MDANFSFIRAEQISGVTLTTQPSVVFGLTVYCAVRNDDSERGAGQRGGVQFTTIVTTTGLMLVTVLTRKRWPSLEATYW